ncbi:hypothetical protein BUALT_Bualt01G0207600 [Buddleja alternifolia]|uniref:Uncharacterized protein n=1 Tax=Buddleja alternifolia TaxID=168488 RepID=A0AAV6YB57_9LAMI|nr:hypothetical protein BUALT_Bualt01G0207600 [Buddleja alternifolia]
MTDQSFAALRDRILELETRIRGIEGFLGTPPELPVVPLFETLQTVGKLQTSVDEIPAFIEERIMSVAEDLSILQDVVDLKLDAVSIEMRIVKRAVGGGSFSSGPPSKFKVPDLKPFEGERSSKELENFLWDMEAYFQAARDVGDVEMGIEGSIPIEFCLLMLDVKDMSGEDKLFNFLNGLQNWAQSELRLHGIKDLQSATAAADRLVDFKIVGAPDSEQGKKNSGKDKNQAKGI